MQQSPLPYYFTVGQVEAALEPAQARLAELETLMADQELYNDAKRFDGEGWYIYVPVGLWAYGGSPLSSHESHAFCSAYDTGSYVMVEKRDSRFERPEDGSRTDGEYTELRRIVELEDGEYFLITARYSESAVAANEYTATEPAAATARQPTYITVLKW